MSNIVIIGNSAAGIAAVESIRAKDKNSKITVISDEDYTAYCRCMLSYYLAGEIKEDKLIYRPQEFYRENNIELILNKKIIRVDPKKNRVIAEDKTQFNYDYLLLATGASPKFPDTKGINKRGVFGFRTIKDTKEILSILPLTHTACVLGGGLIGLKAAAGLKKAGLEVKVIIKSSQVLSQVIDKDAASFFQKKLEDNGVEILTGRDVSELLGNGDLKAVKLDSGKVIACSIVIVGKGVSPNIDLLKETEIKTNEGIIVDENLASSIPNIFAAGDVCESLDITTGQRSINALWPVAVEQGKLAGANIIGENIKYDGSLGMNSLDFFGLSVISLGIIKESEGLEALKRIEPKNNLYKKVILKDNCVVGVILVGEIKNSGIFLRLIKEKTDVSSLKNRLLEDSFSYPDIMDLVSDKEKIYVK